MSTWEDRMAARAATRRESEEAERQRAERENDPHRDHHMHLDGTAVVCSCGEFRGITCVAFPPELLGMGEDEARAWLDENVRCDVCGERGVAGLTG